MALSQEQKNSVIGMMDRYEEMYSAKNLEGLLAICASGIRGYGSGVDEVVQGIASMKVQTKRDFAQADTITIRFDIRDVDGDMPVAWVMADCIFDVKVHGTPLRMTGRMTADSLLGPCTRAGRGRVVPRQQVISPRILFSYQNGFSMFIVYAWIHEVNHDFF